MKDTIKYAVMTKAAYVREFAHLAGLRDYEAGHALLLEAGQRHGMIWAAWAHFEAFGGLMMED